jgi:hypothetical protein
MNKLKVMAALAALLVPLAAGAEMVGVKGSDVQFEDRVTESIGGQQVPLRLTGTALRERMWVNVYAMASYVQEGAAAKSAEELAAADVPKKLVLKMERAVDGKRMSSAFRDGVTQNYKESEFPQELASFSQYFETSPVEVGHVITFTWEPGVGVHAQVADKEPLVIRSTRFAQAVWDIYFGKKNIGSGVKKGLTERL